MLIGFLVYLDCEHSRLEVISCCSCFGCFAVVVVVVVV